MAKNEIDDEEMALACSVDRATISRLRRGKHLPSWPVVLRIMAKTKGQVTANDFVGRGRGAGG